MKEGKKIVDLNLSFLFPFISVHFRQKSSGISVIYSITARSAATTSSVFGSAPYS